MYDTDADADTYTDRQGARGSFEHEHMKMSTLTAKLRDGIARWT